MTRPGFYQLGLRLRTHQQRGWQRQGLAVQPDLHKRTDMVALCCYFDRAAHTLTLGQSHVGLGSATGRRPQAEALTLRCYGVEVRFVDDAGLGLCQRLRETLPPEFVAPSGPAAVAVTYRVTAATSPGQREPEAFLITCDDLPVFATSLDEELYWWLRWDCEQTVARRSPQLLFVHAGVVGWRGVGIVIPGRGSLGKSTLVVELVRRGAVYYSDVFAVLDPAGRVHPYRGMIGLGVEGHSRHLRLVREEGATEPLPIGLIVSGAYAADVVWRPRVVRGPHAVLPLVDSTVLAREQAPAAPEIARQVALSAVELRGPRGEAGEVATLLLDLVDDALVSRALDAAGDSLGHLADDLARVATSRLRAAGGRGASPPRRLIAARHVRVLDLLPPADHRRLLQHMLSSAGEVWEPHTLDATQRGRLHDELWELFDRRLHTLLPYIRGQLELGWFPLGRVEWRVTAHGRGEAAGPRPDRADPQAAGPQISCVYFFQQSAASFRGGALKLYDSWITPSGSTGAGSYTAIEPVDNSLVFFPSDTIHELCPVEPASDASTARSFAIAITFWAVTPPAQAGGSGGAADAKTSSRPRLPDQLARAGESGSGFSSPAAGRGAKGGPRSRGLVAVVVPAHRFPLTADEQIAIRHLRTHLGAFDRYMIGPAAPPPEFADFTRLPSTACDFVDRTSYNRLLMSEEFYRAFAGYEYILIHQLDCLVFSNALEAWCRKGYDYIGAPWFERWHDFYTERNAYPEDIVDGFGAVGNGGFSLRKVDAALAVLTSARRTRHMRSAQELPAAAGIGVHEDIFWSFEAPKLMGDFRIPTPREALQFAFETEPRYCYRENDHRLPFGCHGWAAWERGFWEPFLLT